jgi:hypothetical protein
MIISTDILRRDVVALLKDIEKQIMEVEKFAKGNGIEPFEMRDANGGWVMSPLLLAKTQAYASLVQLNEQGKKR